MVFVDNEAPGETAIADLARLHRDVYNLSYKSLGTISVIINEHLQSEHSKRFTKKQIKSLLKEAYEEKRIDRDKCSDELFEKITQL